MGVNPNAEDNRRHWFWSRSGPVSSCRRRPVRLDGRSRGRRPRGAEDRTSPPPSPYEAAAHAHATDGTYAPASGCGKACRACAINIGARSAGVPVLSGAGFGLLRVSQPKTPRRKARGLFTAPKIPAGAAGEDGSSFQFRPDSGSWASRDSPVKAQAGRTPWSAGAVVAELSSPYKGKVAAIGPSGSARGRKIRGLNCLRSKLSASASS